MRGSGVAERLWFGDALPERVARAALRPLELTYEVVVRTRGVLYDRGLLSAHDTAIPALSVGNLTVGGTGKTPVAAWLAGLAQAAGAQPAIVLRGYGDDEPLVHRLLNPSVPVIVSADRVEGSRRAKAAGADVAILDDAFQHRRASRQCDVVLVSADRWVDPPRLLPAGPFREPLDALARADLVIVTRKAASAAEARALLDRIGAAAPEASHAIVHLAADQLRQVDGPAWRPLSGLSGARVRVATAIGDPQAFLAQLRAHGAVVEADLYPDHHPFSDADVERLARAAMAGDVPVCTLKDAVKLGPRWPRAAGPLWYVSQRVDVEQGERSIHAVVAGLVRARSAP